MALIHNVKLKIYNKNYLFLSSNKEMNVCLLYTYNLVSTSLGVHISVLPITFFN